MAAMEKKAHVICCNNSVKYVLLDDPIKAEEKLEQLSRTDYEEHATPLFRDYNEYRRSNYWHIQSVDYE